MNVTENYMLQQMQQIAASITGLPQTGSKDKSASFQDLMDKTQKDVQKPEAKDENGKPVENKKGEEETAETAPVQNQKKEELRPEDMTANPNAVILDLFRPEITPAAEEAAIPAPVEALPQETVEETAMNLDGQMPTLDTSVETTVEMETPTGEEQGEFRQAMGEPTGETAEVQQQSAEQQPVQQTETEAEAPEQPAEKTQLQDGEVRQVETPEEDAEKLQGETAEPEQTVFRETQATPVKVGERYETVDTQKPDMEAKLADTIRQAAQTGTERVEIRLTPVNLGAVTIEMTKDASGALQVVLHAANSRAAGLLQQHLDGLHTALQSYGAGQEVHVEVQRNQDSQEQHFQQADPDGRGQQQRQRQQENRQDNPSSGQDFIQKLRLGLFGAEETL